MAGGQRQVRREGGGECGRGTEAGEERRESVAGEVGRGQMRGEGMIGRGESVVEGGTKVSEERG